MGELLLPGRARIVFAQKLTRAHKMETRFMKPWFFKECSILRGVFTF